MYQNVCYPKDQYLMKYQCFLDIISLKGKRVNEVDLKRYATKFCEETSQRMQRNEYRSKEGIIKFLNNHWTEAKPIVMEMIANETETPQTQIGFTQDQNQQLQQQQQQHQFQNQNQQLQQQQPVVFQPRNVHPQIFPLNLTVPVYHFNREESRNDGFYSFDPFGDYTFD